MPVFKSNKGNIPVLKETELFVKIRLPHMYSNQTDNVDNIIVKWIIVSGLLGLNSMYPK